MDHLSLRARSYARTNQSRPIRARRCGAVALLAACALALAACGGSSGDSKGSGGKVDLAKGRKLFQQSCKSCHTLADADARGSFGPNLDDLPLDAERVKQQIKIGGGGMPADLYSGKDADTVAEYVAEVAGHG